MDDVIVLILTLIFIAAGIIGQMKKRKVEPIPEANEVDGHNDDFWETLNEEWTESIKTTEKPVEMKQAETTPPDSQGEYHFKSGNKAVRTYRSIAKRDHLKEQPHVSKKARFPLREAVIYSEILNRKYF